MEKKEKNENDKIKNNSNSNINKENTKAKTTTEHRVSYYTESVNPILEEMLKDLKNKKGN